MNNDDTPRPYEALHFALCELRRLRRENSMITKEAKNVQDVVFSQLNVIQAKNLAIRMAISSIHNADLAAALDTLYACLPEGNEYQP
jgi:hypothetical protein